MPFDASGQFDFYSAAPSPVAHHPTTPHTFSPRPTARYGPVTPESRLGHMLEGSLMLHELLGKGAYGVVYSAVDIHTHQWFAVKALSKFNADGSPLDRRQHAVHNREIRLHYNASTHPNIVPMLRIIDEPDCLYAIMEYCPEGDLFQHITMAGQYVGKDELVKGVFLQILDAVEHCHSKGIYHRDLKPENIMVYDGGRTVKLTDFGLATTEDRSDEYGCGSTFYMSPETHDQSCRRPYYMCVPNDIWSLGVILVNLTCGRNPWKQASMDDTTYRAFIHSSDFLKTILPISDQLNYILARIFNPNPEKRVTLASLKDMILRCSSFTKPPQAPVLALPVVPIARPFEPLATVAVPARPETPVEYAAAPLTVGPELARRIVSVGLDWDAGSDSDSEPDLGYSSSSGSSSSRSSARSEAEHGDTAVEDDELDLDDSMPSTPPPNALDLDSVTIGSDEEMAELAAQASLDAKQALFGQSLLTVSPSPQPEPQTAPSSVLSFQVPSPYVEPSVPIEAQALPLSQASVSPVFAAPTPRRVEPKLRQVQQFPRLHLPPGPQPASFAPLPVSARPHPSPVAPAPQSHSAFPFTLDYLYWAGLIAMPTFPLDSILGSHHMLAPAFLQSY